MHATTMHFAFLRAPSVNMKSPLGKRILSIAVAHHEKMEQDLKRQQAMARIRKEVFATPRRTGQTLQQFFIWASEETAHRMKESGYVDA